MPLRFPSRARTSVAKRQSKTLRRVVDVNARDANRLEPASREKLGRKAQSVPRVVRCGADSGGSKHLEIEFRDGGARARQTISLRALAASPDATLAREFGLLTSASKTSFRAVVEAAVSEMPVSFDVVTKPGLHGHHFVLPNGRVLGEGSPPSVCLARPCEDIALRCVRIGGREWLELTRLARANSRVMLVIALALCGPVLELLPDLELPMIQLVGERGTGKSTLARLASSVWGRPDPLTWSQTVNRMEQVAGASSGTLLVLDELGAFDWAQPRSAVAFRGAVMRLFEGTSRGRLNEPMDGWRLGVLSTSNATVDELAAGVGRRDDAFHEAMRSRIIDVPLPRRGHGAFEHLHGADGVDGLVARIRQVMEHHHGSMGPVFVGRMLHRMRCGSAERLSAWLRERRTAYVRESERRHRDGMVEIAGRVRQTFATIYASGRLGIELNILDWSVREFGNALLVCETDHGDLTRSNRETGLVHATDPLAQLRRHVRLARDTITDLQRALLAPEKAAEHGKRDGYLLRGPGGEAEFFVSHARLVAICGSKARSRQLKHQIAARFPQFGDEKRFSVKRTIYQGGGRAQGIAIPVSLLEEDAERQT